MGAYEDLDDKIENLTDAFLKVRERTEMLEDFVTQLNDNLFEVVQRLKALEERK